MSEAETFPLTRRQGYFGHALDDVQAVLGEKNKTAATIYGGLCHTFPILVRTCGLCQALAYVEAKASSKDAEAKAGSKEGARSKAYQWLRANIKARLGFQDADNLLTEVRKAPLRSYMRYTLIILEAWVFYKRFAVSLLKVEAGQDEDALATGLLPVAEDEDVVDSEAAGGVATGGPG